MGGCASKPKDLDTRKMPAPAVRKPHAPPETPVQPALFQEKKDVYENNKERESVDVYVSARASPKVIKEPAAPEGKVEATVEKFESLVPEEKNVVPESVVAKEDKKERPPIEAPKEEREENVVVVEEDKESVVAEEKREVTQSVDEEVAEAVVPEVAEKEEEKVVEETVVSKEKEVAQESVVPEEEEKKELGKANSCKI